MSAQDGTPTPLEIAKARVEGLAAETSSEIIRACQEEFDRAKDRITDAAKQDIAASLQRVAVLTLQLAKDRDTAEILKELEIETATLRNHAVAASLIATRAGARIAGEVGRLLGEFGRSLLLAIVSGFPGSARGL